LRRRPPRSPRGATELAQDALARRRFARVLPRPVTLGAVADAVEELLR